MTLLYVVPASTVYNVVANVAAKAVNPVRLRLLQGFNPEDNNL
jgi:hypothetical protein